MENAEPPIRIICPGRVCRNVLELNGIDSKVYSGYALGMGIERITNLKYQVKDLRMFSENDVRFLKEFEAQTRSKVTHIHTTQGRRCSCLVLLLPVCIHSVRSTVHPAFSLAPVHNTRPLHRGSV